MTSMKTEAEQDVSTALPGISENEGESHADPSFDHQDIPPADIGLAAWRFLFGAFVIEALLWGFLITFGVFQDYYSTHPPLEEARGISWIGVLGTGVLFLGSPIMASISKTYHQWQKHFIWLGFILCVVALISASFCDSLGSLAATQGVLYGLGFLILYYPVLSMLNEWFVSRRGLAYGILFGAAGLSGVVLPFVVETLLSKYGYRTTLRAFGIAIFLLSGPAIFLLRRRTQNPLTPPTDTPSRQDTYYRSLQFYLLALSNLFQAFAFYLPLIYLPSYATSLGYAPSRGALLLSLANAAQVVGQAAYGRASDKTGVHALMVLSSGLSGLAVLLLWGFAKSLVPLAVFALLYGGFAGGFVVLWPRVGTLFGEADAHAVYSFFAFEKGIGNVASGPISAALMTKAVRGSEYAVARYEGVVAFVGACLLMSAALAAVAWWDFRAPRPTPHTVESES